MPAWSIPMPRIRWGLPSLELVTYNGGVVLGADSRTSTGMYVANKASNKITQLRDNVYVCRSASAADSQIVSDYVRYFLNEHTIQLVKVAANLVRLLSYGNKNMLQTGWVVGGWDKYEGGKIYGKPLGGTILDLPSTIGGICRGSMIGLAARSITLSILLNLLINKDGVVRKFYPGDELPLWHEELEPKDSLLDILSATSPEPMVS